MWQRFQALPAYPGGKRRLAPRVLKSLPGPDEAPTWVEGFLGGGSTALMVKAKGYRVVCADVALRSYIVGQALISNDRVTLSKEDLTRLFVDNDNNTRFIERKFAPDVLTTRHAEFLDNAFANARAAAGTKKYLLLLLLIRYVLKMRPMGNFGAKTVVHQAEAGRWEEMNPNFVRDMLARSVCSHPKTIVETLRTQINRGVFSNGQTHRVEHMDVFDFLREVRGDIIYHDPPYGSQTLSYESSLKVLDSILEGLRVEPKPSYFSKAPAMEALERLFEASRRFPIWVVSYGNAELELDEIVGLVSKFKTDVRAESVRYVHMTGLSSDEHRKRNREFIIVAKGDR